MNENQNIETKKRRGALKWIITTVVAVGIIASVSCGKEEKPTTVVGNSTETTVTTETVSAETETATPETFGVGDTVEYKDVKVTLNSITENSGSQFNKPTDGNVFLLVDFTIENNTDSELAVSSMLSFDAYQDGYSTSISLSALIEKTGEQLDGTIAPGKKMQGTIGYEVPATYSEFEISFNPDVWSSDKFTFVYNK